MNHNLWLGHTLSVLTQNFWVNLNIFVKHSNLHSVMFREVDNDLLSLHLNISPLYLLNKLSFQKWWPTPYSFENRAIFCYKKLLPRSGCLESNFISRSYIWVSESIKKAVEYMTFYIWFTAALIYRHLFNKSFCQ